MTRSSVPAPWKPAVWWHARLWHARRVRGHYLRAAAGASRRGAAHGQGPYAQAGGKRGRQAVPALDTRTGLRRRPAATWAVHVHCLNCAMVLRSSSHYSGRDLSPIPGSREGSMHKKDRWDAAAPQALAAPQAAPVRVSVFPSELTTSAELSE